MIRFLLLAFCFSPLWVNDATADSGAPELVKYRLESWKAKHIHDTAKADQLADILKKLGCEVQKNAHNGHVDIKYRCPQWRQLTLEKPEEAVRWEKWLKQNLFETQRMPKGGG